MGIFSAIKKKVVITYIESKDLMDRYINLPLYAKIIISPIIIALFFTLFFPVIITLGILYKILSIIFKVLTNIISNRVVILTTIKYFLLSLFVFIIFSFLLLLLLTFYIQIIPHLPSLLLKLISFLMFPYLLTIFFINGNELTKDLKETINSINKSNDDINELKETIRKASGNKASKNPLLWFYKSPFTILLVGTLSFAGSLFAVILSSATINEAFPHVFFSGYESVQNHLHFWILYILDQLLIIIPINVIGPFFSENTGKLIQQPWGGVLSILFQIFLAYMTYQYISILFISAKYSIQRKYEIDKPTCSNNA